MYTHHFPTIWRLNVIGTKQASVRNERIQHPIPFRRELINKRPYVFKRIQVERPSSDFGLNDAIYSRPLKDGFQSGCRMGCQYQLPERVSVSPRRRFDLASMTYIPASARTGPSLCSLPRVAWAPSWRDVLTLRIPARRWIQ